MIFTQKEAEKIAEKLGADFKEKRHLVALIRYKGKIVAQYGIRRSSKAVGHDYIPLVDIPVVSKREEIRTFFIPGPLPGLNEIIGAAKRSGNAHGRQGKRWNAYSEMKNTWQGIIAAEIKRAKITPVKVPVFIIFGWWETNKKRDPDNIAGAKKLILDSLVSTGILAGDGWKHINGWEDSFEVASNRSGVWVSLLTYE